LAIVQISRITQRKGLQEDLPQLAGAELGWSVDERRLFIGNGTLEEGAPVVGNTEILTEFSDILVLVQDYTYSGQAATGYTVQTGVTSGTPVELSLQNWMDQFATVKDFGAVGDGVADDTAAINRALYQLYCREVNPAIRRSLFFPAGVYKVSDTIVIPPYATLKGEGPKNSIIQMTATASATYVMRTGDSLQQTGVNIGTNGARSPLGVTCENMCFKSLKTIDIACIEQATEFVFNQVEFLGPLTTADLTTPVDDTACIRFASTVANDTHQIKFDNCAFSGCTYGMKTDAQVRGIDFSGSNFETLYEGVVIEPNPLGTAFDPRGVGVHSCDFDTIYARGIVFEVERNATAQNTFGDVGNHFGGITQPFSSIIDFISANNISVGDIFDRTDQYATTHQRINLNGTASIGFTNGQQMAMGPYVRESGLTVSLTNNITSPATAVSYSELGIWSLGIDYNIYRANTYRTGRLSIVLENGAGALTYTDDFSENSSTGITLTVTQSGSEIFVKYISTNTGSAGSLTYSITHIQ
tara:strand:- start:1761 stop:3344 length:1584 start_codon:yes stop_codon:yes gene_type:complete